MGGLLDDFSGQKFWSHECRRNNTLTVCVFDHCEGNTQNCKNSVSLVFGGTFLSRRVFAAIHVHYLCLLTHVEIAWFCSAGNSDGPGAVASMGLSFNLYTQKVHWILWRFSLPHLPQRQSSFVHDSRSSTCYQWYNGKWDSQLEQVSDERYRDHHPDSQSFSHNKQDFLARSFWLLQVLAVLSKNLEDVCVKSCRKFGRRSRGYWMLCLFWCLFSWFGRSCLSVEDMVSGVLLGGSDCACQQSVHAVPRVLVIILCCGVSSLCCEFLACLYVWPTLLVLRMFCAFEFSDAWSYRTTMFV